MSHDYESMNVGDKVFMLEHPNNSHTICGTIVQKKENNGFSRKEVYLCIEFPNKLVVHSSTESQRLFKNAYEPKIKAAQYKQEQASKLLAESAQYFLEAEAHKSQEEKVQENV